MCANELAQEPAVNVIAYEEVQALPSVLDVVLVMILHNDRAITELVKLAGVFHCGPAPRVALREEELRRPVDARLDLADLVYLAFPACAQLALDDILARQYPPGLQIKGAYVTCRHPVAPL